MAVNPDSKEKEVIVLPGMPFEINVERLIGPNSPLVMPPRYLDEYVSGREQIRKLYKRHNKGADGEHDMVHSARVLFLALSIIQAGKLKLSTKELQQLSEAIVYHDIGRSDDEIDMKHGAASRRIYKSSRKNCDTVTAFLIEYHCIDDEQAETYLQHSPIKGKSRAWLLYQTRAYKNPPCGLNISMMLVLSTGGIYYISSRIRFTASTNGCISSKTTSTIIVVLY